MTEDSEQTEDNNAEKFIHSSSLLFKTAKGEINERMKATETKFIHSSDSVLFKKSDKKLNFDKLLAFKIKSNKCSMNCTKNCGDAVKSFSEEDIECIRIRLKCSSDIKTSNSLLGHLKSQSDLGVGVRGYVFKGHTFCIKSFSDVTKISEYMLKKVLKDFHYGANQYIHGNLANPRESLASVKLSSWLKTFSQLYGQSAPDECTTVLPSWLTKATIYRIYLEEATPPFVKQSNFYKLFKEKFGSHRNDKSLPHVRISKYSTHSVCPQCVALASYQKSCKTQLELELCKSMKFKHKQRYGLARRRICELQEMAVTYPRDHLFISLDGMDNRKSDLPKFQQNVKNLGNFQKLPSHITGAIVTSGLYPEKMKNFFFINHNQYEQGSNMIITIIYHLLQSFLLEHKKFPKYLHINADNCGRENKNRYVFTYLAALVELGIFSEITMDFLVVGHTGKNTHTQEEQYGFGNQTNLT